MDANTSINGEPYYIDSLSFPTHLYVISTWIGLFLTSLCGGVGIIFMPYNLLNDWIFRPKYIDKQDFVKR